MSILNNPDYLKKLSLKGSHWVFKVAKVLSANKLASRLEVKSPTHFAQYGLDLMGLTTELGSAANFVNI